MSTDNTKKQATDMNSMDRRLEAIKEIIIGKNLEKIEAKIGSVSESLERSNGRILEVVEQLNKELKLVKTNLEEKIEANDEKAFNDDEEIRNDVFKLKEDAKNLIEQLQEKDEELETSYLEGDKNLELSQQMLEKDLLASITELKDELEENILPLLSNHGQKISKHNELLKNHEEDLDTHGTELDAHAKHLEQLKQALANQEIEISSLKNEVKRIDTLEETLLDIKEQFSSGLASLADEVSELKKVDGILYESLNEEVEDRKTDFEQLENRVANSQGEMKAYLSERSRVFVHRQQKLEERMEGVDDRLLALHDLLEDEVFNYFEDLNKHKKFNRKQLQALQQEFADQIEEAIFRLEGRVDGILASQRKDIKKLNKKFKSKDSLRRTLGRLGDLLDD